MIEFVLILDVNCDVSRNIDVKSTRRLILVVLITFNRITFGIFFLKIKIESMLQIENNARTVYQIINIELFSVV